MKLIGTGRMMGLSIRKGNKPSMSTSLRHNEYYKMQETFDWLYHRSKNNSTRGLDLYKIIISRRNILLAYRNIKANTGSKTKGTDGLTIKDYKIKDEIKFIQKIRVTLENYKPCTVRRVEIPKENGENRPLGIPTMEDRIIQQMFKQVLEPICEARFHNHSYGFRPNRSTHHAMSRSQTLVNKSRLHHVVDIDIKGFFDNVNHKKLLKQMYNIGIKDSRVLKIINKMLKAPIQGEGIPTKGTPQGGILSPLLSNIVLNDLDWWISNQWESFKSRYKYSENGSKYQALKQTGLKVMFIVRYADDFKIFTRTHEEAHKIFHAAKKYLKRNLKLDISSEKSMVTNLRKKPSGFLGFKIKAAKKGDRRVAYTFVMDKKKEKIKETLRKHYKILKNNTTVENVNKYNAYIIGIKNYYQYATHINIDFSLIAYQTSRTLYNRLKAIGKYGPPQHPNAVYKQYNKNNFKTFNIGGVPLHVLADIQTKNVRNFSQDICNYTEEGRRYIHKKLQRDIAKEIFGLSKYVYKYNTVELADNKLSKYSAQRGMCAITGQFLDAGNVSFHHKTPKTLGGTDEFKNLVAIITDVHILIHSHKKETIEKYMSKLSLTIEQIEKVNKYREQCNLNNLV